MTFDKTASFIRLIAAVALHVDTRHVLLKISTFCCLLAFCFLVYPLSSFAKKGMIFFGTEQLLDPPQTKTKKQNVREGGREEDREREKNKKKDEAS